MRRLGIPALPPGGHGPCLHAVAELNHRREAVPAGAVPFPCPLVGTRTERSEEAPARPREGHRDAWPGVIERLHDITGEALEPVVLAPRRLPVPEARLE